MEAPSSRGLLNSEYVLSLVRADQPIPDPALPELALAGRANVGKSSLLNLLVGRKALARVSATPGKTRALNVFNWGDRCYLVDVPGYGWSRAGQADRAAWRGLVMHYIAERPTLKGALWLLDIRHDPSAEDISFGAMLARRKLPILPVLTKADKIGGNQRPQRIESIAKKVGLPPADFVVTSSLSREGQETLRDVVLAFLS